MIVACAGTVCTFGLNAPSRTKSEYVYDPAPPGSDMFQLLLTRFISPADGTLLESLTPYHTPHESVTAALVQVILDVLV